MRALLSLWDKTGLVELAGALHELGWELVASGGTAVVLGEAGLPVTTVESVTGSPEMLGGRVKTLHPSIHGGILADRSEPEHLADLEAQGIGAIDLVVCNLYPFVARPSIETIDVGGPTMVRAAAKNHAHVGVVVDPADYPAVVDELRSAGALSDGTRQRLARAAFAHTAAYDSAIASWLTGDTGLPPTIHLALERAGELRYGENPHQAAARYRQAGGADFWDSVRQHGGMELSYLNVVDADAAWRLAHDLGDRPGRSGHAGRPAAAIIKHANPCGAAIATTLADAYERAFECDERSAFGGIVALSQAVDRATVERMVAAAQADVVIAPGYTPGTIEALQAKRK
ncbi:MAG: bifunctional phosphoribosylaminoimidazolecarboxamide formyltransferase/IMP cyclohydrolase, partial [Acidimicrobiales bacterium]